MTALVLRAMAVMAGRDPDAVRRTAEEILARPEYRPPGKSLLQRALEWVGRRLQWLIDRLPSVPAGAGANLIGWLVLIALAAVAVWFGVRAVRGVRWGRPHRRRARRRQHDDVEVRVEEAPLPASALREAADRAAAAGRYDQAVRWRYRALVSELEADGVVPKVAGRTTGDERSAVAARVPLASPPFDGASELFDRTAYGGAQPSDADDARLRTLARDVVDAVER